MSETGHKFRVYFVNKKEFWLGAALILLGFLMPRLFTVQNFRILDLMQSALHNNEKMDLLMAALRLAVLNALRALPHYLGSFMIAESLEFRWEKYNLWPFNALLVFALLRVTYAGIAAFTSIHYDFGLPAVLVTLLIILFDRMDYKYVALGKKSMLVCTGLIAFQFLDIMPAVARKFPVGRGETSTNIKLIAGVLGADDALNIISCAGLLLFLAFTLLFFILLSDENRLRELAALREQNETIRTEARINEIKNRTYQEMQHLVHDLKSPLTVVQTVAGALKYSLEAEKREQDVELLAMIERSVDQMSRMISEILYNDKANPTTVERLVNRLSAQLSIESFAENITVEVSPEAAETVVLVNSVLFPRAIVNLVENGAKAVPENRRPELKVTVDVEGNLVRFQVQDNGKGISTDDQQRIWLRGYSGRNSSGLGLAFVQQVVETSGGTLALDSKLNVGTTFTIYLPREESEKSQGESVYESESDHPVH